jgi:hypothetical protein
MLCENILRRLGAGPALVSDAIFTEDEAAPDTRAMRVLYACRKFQWDKGEKQLALEGLIQLTKMRTEPSIDVQLLKSSWLLQCADWMREHKGYELLDILSTLREARELASDSYFAWHKWALFNYMVVQQMDSAGYADEGVMEAEEHIPTNYFSTENDLRKRGLHRGYSSHTKHQQDSVTSRGDIAGGYVIEAIMGFTRSLSLSNDQPIVNVLQDTLRLLTLWFAHGSRKQVTDVLAVELEKVSTESWLGVLPQLIARLVHITTPSILSLLQKLLIKIAVSHPQAIVCPILVAYNTNDEHQKLVAGAVIQDLRLKYKELVAEAMMVIHLILGSLYNCMFLKLNP